MEETIIDNKLGNLIGVLNYDLENTKQNNNSPNTLFDLETDMQHTIQQLMDKVSAMHGLAVQAPREKYRSPHKRIQC